MAILAMDLGKYSTVFCKYDGASGEHTFGTVKTRPQDMHDLFVTTEPEKVVMEVCGIAGWICDIAEALGIETEVANTTHEAWRWKNVKKKTDREDALKLAKLSAMGQIPIVHIPQKEVREKRSLMKYRQQLVRYRTGIKNGIREIFSREGMAMPRGAKAWSQEGLAWLRGHAVDFEKISDIRQLWQGQLYVELGLLQTVTKSLKAVERKLDKMASCDERIKRLQTIKGVGPRLSEVIVAFLDDPKRFKNAKHVAGYAGLAPRQYQSGQMERQGKTGGRGNKLLRNLLVEVCWVSLRTNPWARDTYRRLLRGSSSRKKVAITALARKLLVRCWAMLRDEVDWDDDRHKSAA